MKKPPGRVEKTMCYLIQRAKPSHQKIIAFPVLFRNEAGHVCFPVPLQLDWSNLLVPQFSPGQVIWFQHCWRIRTPPHAPGGCYPQSG